MNLKLNSIYCVLQSLLSRQHHPVISDESVKSLSQSKLKALILQSVKWFEPQSPAHKAVVLLTVLFNHHVMFYYKSI